MAQGRFKNRVSLFIPLAVMVAIKKFSSQQRKESRELSRPWLPCWGFNSFNNARRATSDACSTICPVYDRHRYLLTVPAEAATTCITAYTQLLTCEQHVYYQDQQ